MAALAADRGFMKKSKSIVLMIAPVLSTVLLTACGGGGGASTSRDVYESVEDCTRDWGEAELCEQMNDDDDREYRSSGGVFVAGRRPYWGPQYYPGDRSVMYKGRTISPTTSSSKLRPFSVTPRSSSYSRSSVSTPRSSSTSYGGFGSRSSSTSSGG